MKERISATISSSGTRNRRSFAFVDSTTATIIASPVILTRKAAAPSATAETDQLAACRGEKHVREQREEHHELHVRCVFDVSEVTPRILQDHGSWIMVSSRCVSGLSTGSLPVSAMVAMNSPENASRWGGIQHRRGRGGEPGDNKAQVRGSRCDGRGEDGEHHCRFNDGGNRHLAAGAESPNAFPASSPARARKNLPAPKR